MDTQEVSFIGSQLTLKMEESYTSVLVDVKHEQEEEETAEGGSSTEESLVESLHLVMSPVSKQERKAFHQRRRRRKLYLTTESVEIGGLWSEISQNFRLFYDSLLSTRASCFECFQVVLNSLTSFYRRTNESYLRGGEIQKLVVDFLHKFFGPMLSDEDEGKRDALMAEFVNRFIAPVRSFFIDSAAVASTENDYAASSTSQMAAESGSNQRKLLECELLVLMELHLLRTVPRHLAQTNIVPRIRLLFSASSAERVKRFLNETVCDEFIDELPHFLAGIYEALLLEPPIDLQRFQSLELVEGSKAMATQELREENQNKMVSRLVEFMAEIERDREELATSVKQEAESSTSDSQRGRKAGKRSRSKQTTAKSPSESVVTKRRKKTSSGSPCSRSASMSQDDASTEPGLDALSKKPIARRRLLYVPETPKKQLIKIDNDENKKSGNDVVQNTPIGKIRKDKHSDADSKMARLLKSEEERLKQLAIEQKEARRRSSIGLLCSTANTQPPQALEVEGEVKEPKFATSSRRSIASSRASTSTGPTSSGNARSRILLVQSAAERKAKRKIEFAASSASQKFSIQQQNV